MNYSVSFLLKILCVAAVLHGMADKLVYADDSTEVLPGGGTEILQPIVNDSVSNTLIFCPAGQYVYKCGDYRVGFNWLKSISITNTYTSENCSSNGGVWNTDSNTCDVITKNYYISNDQSELLDQMRDFFGGIKTEINHCKTWDNNNNTCTETELTNDYKNDRDKIFSNLCSPFDSNISVTCAYCPNSANIEQSTVVITSYRHLNTATLNWKLHTIADCYLKEFTDSTGTYEYLSTNQIDSTAERCYYTNTNPEAFDILQGDSISDANFSNEAVTVYIPKSDSSSDF